MGTIKKSFTFIELVVTVGIVALIVPAIFSISFIIFRQQATLSSLYEGKRQGDAVAKIIKIALTTNARKIVNNNLDKDSDVCPPLTTPTPTFFPQLYVQDREGNNYSFWLEDNPTPTPNRIASSGASLSFLTSGSVTILNLAFSCYKSVANGASIITTKYTVNKNGQSLDYRFKVRLNSY